MANNNFGYGWAIGLGFFAGLRIVAMIGRWLKLVVGLRQSAIVGGEMQPQARALGIPLLSLASPTPWLAFAALPYAAFHFIYLRKSNDAVAFFSTIGSLVILWLVVSIATIMFFKRRKRMRMGK